MIRLTFSLLFIDRQKVQISFHVLKHISSMAALIFYPTLSPSMLEIRQRSLHNLSSLGQARECWPNSGPDDNREESDIENLAKIPFPASRLVQTRHVDRVTKI